MPTINELLDSLNEENVSEIKEQLKAEADALHKSNKQLYARAKKAEGFEYDHSKKDWIKADKKEEKPEATASKSDAPDYSKQALELSQKAMLNSLGYINADDQKYILGEAERLKQDVSEVLNDSYHKAKLKEMNDTREAQGGMGKGSGKTGGGTSDSVDYWLEQKNPDGTFKTPDDVELAEKVIDARIHREEAKSKFSDILYTG